MKRLESGVVREVVPERGDQGVPRWSPDGSALVAWDHSFEPGAIFVIHRAPDDRWSRPAWKLTGAQLPVWAPDGRTIAFVTPEGRVEAVARDSGATRVLYAPRPGSDDPRATYLAWDAGRGELWLLAHTPSGKSGVWSLPIAGGGPRLVVDFTDDLGRLNGPTLTSDGRRLYFTLDERRGNVWLAELVK